MKKRALAFALLALICAVSDISVSAAEFNPPTWNELCPAEYKNAVGTILDKDSMYWYNRRIEFDASLDECAELEEDKIQACYDKVRAHEEMLNAKWQNEKLDKIKPLNSENAVLKENMLRQMNPRGQRGF